ncbi:hypothetical protein BGX31_001001 [Mortierella sp. GBA43]|nr:hypothetical protein BGX31_001001 [Mortierella sp. GBA43]
MRQSKNARSILSNSLQGQSTTNNPSGLQFETTFESPDQHSDSIASQPLQSTTSSSSQDPAPPQPGDNAPQNYHHHGYTDNDNGGGIDITDESRNYVPIPDTKSEYHEDYWSTNPPLDGGYSSSTSTASSYSSVSSSSAMQASRAANPRGFGMHSSTECFANLQSLEYDPEPLLTEHTIDRILRAGKTVVLTREYVGSKGERRDSGRMRSYLSSEDDDDYLTYRDAGPADDYTDLGEVEINGAESERLARAIRTGAGFSFEQDAGSDMDSTSSRYSSEGSYFPPVESALSASYENSTKYVAAHSKAGYADFVQGLHPTWSQSPAPSPNIIKEDPNINPFFFQPLTSYPTMDDDAFDPPDPTPESTEDGHSSSSEHGTPEHIDGSRNYSASLPQTHGPASTNTSKASIPTQPASILANARSLIHMPLYRSMDRNSQRYLPSDIQHQRPPAMPVGIISFLSDQVPYPPEALDILTELNPFIANQVTNALRLEDVVARSSRWGDMSSSSMSDGVRTKETFTESIQRKMKENYDPGTSRAMSSNPTVPHAGLKQPSDRHFFKYAYEEAAERTNSPAAIPHQQSQSTRPPKGAPVPDSDHDDQYAEASTMDHHDSDVFGTTGDSIDSLASEAQSNNNDKPSLEKQPEIYFNLDTTEDEIHRSLNLLNLDITGSATCPLAPQTKRMLGKQHHHSSKHAQSHQIENAFLSTWNGNRRRTESSPQALDTEDQDTDGMWQTLSTDEFDQRPHSLPNTRIVDNDFDLVGHESPYHGPLRTLSPSITPRRHHFSASKRSGFGKRRKSMREQMKHQPHHPHTSGSPVPSSPYISTIPGFCSQQCETSSSCPGFCSGVFSPDPSPMASPTVHQSGIFGHAFGMVDPRKAPDAGSYSKLQSGNQGRDRNERTPLSRHGSGWSITSDDTSLASQSTQNDKHAAGRKQKKRHNTISSERPAHNPFPRTRLLRLIVDAIPHHVFTLSPQSGCMTWLNQRSLQYTGVPLVQLLHTPWTRLLHEDDRETFQPLFKDCFERGEMFNAQYRVRRFDGQYRWFLGRVLPVRDCGNNIVHWFGTSTDIHDQKLAELQLNRQIELELNEKKYRLLAEAIPQIVFTATPQGGLTYANAKWFTYSGQVFEQACGLGFMDHVHPEDRAKCFLPTNISSGMRSPPAASESESDARYSTSPGTAYGQGPGDVSYQTEMRLLRKDGKYRWFLVKCISVEVVEQGRKWFGTCTDINDQKLLEHKLKEAHDAAQKSTESKTRFLSNMSHEIRTPLVGISGMVGFLITTDLTSEQLEYVHTVQQSAEALLLVINDILDLSKVEAGMMKLEMEPFSIHAMIEGANELLSTLAIQKGLELGFLVEDDVPEIVVGDRIRLRQVLINIIGNAIKFTTHGEVFSRCSLVPPTKPNANSDELTIRFEISDTGKGFDESERAVMFKPFSQVDTSSTRKHGGTGLGLVLSKEFVELHGGQIQCESVKGQGSKFSFTFVAHVPPPNAAAARVTTPISTSEAHMDGLLGDNLSSVRTPAVSPSGFKLAGPKELKSQTEPSLLKHITGLKLIPGEMCFAEPDPEDTRKTASEAFKMVNQKIERGEFVALGTTLRRNATDLDDGATEAKAAPSSGPSLSSTGPGSGVEERRYPRSGQITPSQPPMGEPASVAIVAANIPNPAVDMKLTIPVKMLESKRAAAAAAAAAIAATAAESTSSSQPSRPDLPSSSNSSNSSSSASTSSSNDSKISASTDESSSTSTSSVSPPTLGVNVDAQEQPRILIIADFPHARETIVHLINQLIPKDLNPLLDVAKGMEEGIEFLMGERQHVAQTSKYNYLVINMAEYMAVMEVFSVVQRDGVNLDPNVMTCMITTPVQRVALMEAVKYEVASMELAKPCSDQPPVKVIPERIEWVFKPLTKSKLYVAFADVAGRHDSPSDATGSGASVLAGFDDSSKVDMKRKSAQQVALSQQKVFTQMREALEGKGIRILLAEDDMTNQRVIRRYFQKVGVDLVIANDGNECLDTFVRLPKGHFSLILCDLFMPGRDGYAATRAIRDWEDEHLQEGEKRIPIVALSANVMANVAEKCLSSGFTSYLSKPVDFKRLSDTLRNSMADLKQPKSGLKGDTPTASATGSSYKAKIQLVMKIMFDMETRQPKLTEKPPPPGDPEKMSDDDIYVLWCAAPNTKWYKQELFKLIEELKAKEETERVVRLKAVIVNPSSKELSSHAQHLRAKMDAVKRAAFEFYPLKAEGKTRSVLPRDPDLMDVDIFLVWCLRADEYKECRRADRYLGCRHTTFTSYEQELGCLLESLGIKYADELEYLHVMKSKWA